MQGVITLRWTGRPRVCRPRRMETSATALPPPDGPGPLPSPPLPAPQQARSDEHLVALWLHGRSAGTRRACAADLAAFFAHARRPLPAVTPGDLQAFQDMLASLASATQARRLSASNQLLPFGHKTGHPPSSSAPPSARPRSSRSSPSVTVLDQNQPGDHAQSLCLVPQHRSAVPGSSMGVVPAALAASWTSWSPSRSCRAPPTRMPASACAGALSRCSDARSTG